MSKNTDFEWLKIHLDSLRSNLQFKAGLVPTIASLAATLLVIATFNEKLIEVTNSVKIVLTVLLLIIPTSFF